jgi:hypothetical protein
VFKLRDWFDALILVIVISAVAWAGITMLSSILDTSYLQKFQQVDKSATSTQAESFGANHKHSEPWYTQAIAKQYGWQAEVRTSIGTRCDLLSDSLAIEVEWPSKPFEAVGQSLHYSEQLGKQPAILFLLSDRATYEQQFVLKRVGEVAGRHGIRVLWYSTIDETFIDD